MIIGHKEQQQKLCLLSEKQQIPHALLFSGPEGVGKRTVAVWFLKMINCESAKAPCGSCRSCYEIGEKIHPDMLEIFPQEKEIQIKQIEEAIEKISYKGIKAQFKGVVIDKAHLMNTQTQNALLKTLEEPSKDTIIILVSEYPHLLFPTILSRVFEIKFSFVDDKEITRVVEDEEAVELSFGKPGKALDYLHFPERKKIAKGEKKKLQEMSKKDVVSRFSIIKKVTDEQREEEFLNCWLKVVREEMINRIRAKKETATCRQVLVEIEEAILLYSKTNTNTRLLLEKIALKI